MLKSGMNLEAGEITYFLSDGRKITVTSEMSPQATKAAAEEFWRSYSMGSVTRNRQIFLPNEEAARNSKNKNSRRTLTLKLNGKGVF